MSFSSIIQQKFNEAFESKALTAIDTTHRRVHEGEVFYTSYRLLAVADDGVLKVRIVTGSVMPHLFWMVDAGGDSTLDFVEGSTYSNDGVGIAVYNMNRECLTPLLTRFYSAPTINPATGTIIATTTISGGTKSKASGGSGSRGTEWVLKRDTEYYFVMQNLSGAAQNLSVQFELYEDNETT